jgi:hypothetical protein
MIYTEPTMADLTARMERVEVTDVHREGEGQAPQAGARA